MAILDQLRWVAGQVIGRNIASHNSINSQALYDSELRETVSSNPSQKLENYSNSQRRQKIRRIVTGLGKFAVSSAVDDTLEIVSGGNQSYKGVNEGLKAGRNSRSDHNKKPRSLAVVVEEMQAKVETVEEEMNNATQLQSSNHCVEPSDDLKDLSAEPSDELTPQKADKRKIFIRSRL